MFEDKEEDLWQCHSHDKALEMIVRDTNLIGIPPEKVNYRAREMEFHEGRTLKGAADLVLCERNSGYIWVIEYKCSHHDISQKKAEKQLLAAKKGLKEEYGLNVNKLLYVHGPAFYVKELQHGFQPLNDNRDYVHEFIKKMNEKF